MSALRTCIIGLAASAALVVGCSREEGPELAPVSGRVLMNGRPLSNVRVVFSLGHSRPSTGITDEDGNYELRYTISHNGALPGEHQVRFYKLEGADEEGGQTLAGDVELVREVKPGNNVFDFEL